MRWMIFAFLLTGCAGTALHDDLTIVVPSQNDLYQIATIQHITDEFAPVHVYIEGDGHAFNAHGRPTRNPTPRGRLVRDMAAADMAPNVLYIARPCQFIMDKKCTTADWTTGRFSHTMVDSVANAIKSVAGTRPVILVGYSGGAMIAGLIIQNHPEINVKKWITIAGVLNHDDWTRYFNDTPLTQSLNMNTLPRVPTTHYIAERDKTVPRTLSEQWLKGQKIIVVPNATHGNIKIKNIDFND